jgi:protein-L-isoaspartate O-methyltransferase
MFGFLMKFSTQKDLAKYLCKEIQISDPKIAEALASIPRESFLPDEIKHRALEDIPLKIEPFGFPTS